MPTTTNLFRALVPSLLALVASTGAARAGFQDIGVLEGGDYAHSRAYGISGNGQVVLGSSTLVYVGDWVETYEEIGVRWDAGALTPVKPLVLGHERSTARTASYDGTVIGGTVYRYSGYPEAGYPEGGFLWEAGGVSILPDAPGGSSWSNARALSGDGSVVVGYSVDGVNDHAAIWASGGFTSLALNLGWNYATGVSEDGTAISGFDENLGAIRWDSGIATPLPMPAGSFSGRAEGISADGGTVVGRTLRLQGNVATRWDDGVPEVLGTLPGDVTSYALDASGDGGVVVGYSADDQGGRTAVVWLPHVGLRSLHDVLENLGDPVAGWVLREARGVSDDGLGIAGWGVNPDGLERGFVATLPAPEPSFGLGVGLGAAILGSVVRSGAKRRRPHGRRPLSLLG